MKKALILIVVIAVGTMLAWEWNIRRGLKQDMLVAFARYDLLTEERYRGGVESFLANLVAQRSLYQARREEVAVSLIALQNRFELYRVLGSDAELANAPFSPE